MRMEKGKMDRYLGADCKNQMEDASQERKEGVMARPRPCVSFRGSWVTGFVSYLGLWLEGSL